MGSRERKVLQLLENDGTQNRRMRWETWVREFKPVLDKEGDPRRFETYDEDLKEVVAIAKKTPGKVWTMVDGDSGRPLICEGFHVVNRIVYFVTEVPAEENVFYSVSL